MPGTKSQQLNTHGTVLLVVLYCEKTKEKKEEISLQNLVTGYFVKGRNTEKGRENRTRTLEKAKKRKRRGKHVN